MHGRQIILKRRPSTENFEIFEGQEFSLGGDVSIGRESAYVSDEFAGGGGSAEEGIKIVAEVGIIL